MPLGRDEIQHRLGYHPGTSVTVPMHERVRTGFIALAEFLDDLLPDGEAKDLAFVKLQESSMWSNYCVAELSPVVVPDKKSSAKPTPPPSPGTFGPSAGPPAQRQKE